VWEKFFSNLSKKKNPLKGLSRMEITTKNTEVQNTKEKKKGSKLGGGGKMGEGQGKLEKPGGSPSNFGGFWWPTKGEKIRGG